MPPLAARYLRTALAFLVLGVLTGLHMATAHHFGLGEMHPYYVPAHTHVLLIGFLLMALMGVALWKLPAPARASAARERLARACYWALTLGTLLRYTAETTLGYVLTASWLRYVIVGGMLVQSLAILACCGLVWPRLRATGE